MPRSALLLGATGLVGGHCLKLLLQEQAYEKVFAFVRKPLPFAHPKLDARVVDFEKPEARAAQIRAHDVFCCLGTTIKQAGSQAAFRKVDFEYPYRLAEFAVQNGAQQFLLVSALGADPASAIFYNRVKGEIEAAITKLPFRSIHILRPSLLLGERPEPRFGEKFGEYVFKTTALLWRGPLRKYRPITAQAVALALLHYAKQERSGVHMHESLHIENLIQLLQQ